jgi:glycyl-tRNA synthetase
LAGIDKYELLSDLAKRRGFFWPSFEIYGGVSGYLDLGPLGSRLKRRIEDKWLKVFVDKHGYVTVSTPVIMPEKIFQASGHVAHFKDLMVTCTQCRRHFKADYVITQAMPARTDIATEAMSAEEIDRFIIENHIRCPECGGVLGKSEFYSTMFRTNIGPYSDIVGYGRPEAAQGIFVDFKRVFEATRERLPIGIAQIGTVMRNEISPRQGPIRLREFTIMEMEFFFDPEDAACPYLEGVEAISLPILLAKEREQGKTEITEIHPRKAVKERKIITEWGAYFMALSIEFVRGLGIPKEKQRFEEKMQAERSHYSAQTFDHQIWLDRWGWVEVAGHAYRTDFDLSAHIKVSGADLSIFKPYEQPVTKKTKVVLPQESVLGPLLRERTKTIVEALKAVSPEQIEASFTRSGFFEIDGVKILPSQVRIEEKAEKEAGRRVVPHVVEPSFGAERLVYAALEYAYSRVQDRVVLKLPIDLAPTQLTVFPLMAKDGLPEIAMQIRDALVEVGFEADYDEAGTIGRRYARADEIGVPLSVTVDYKTKEDQTVTIRDRDSWRQVRSDRRKLPELASRYFRGEAELRELGTPVDIAYE